MRQERSTRWRQLRGSHWIVVSKWKWKEQPRAQAWLTLSFCCLSLIVILRPHVSTTCHVSYQLPTLRVERSSNRRRCQRPLFRLFALCLSSVDRCVAWCMQSVFNYPPFQPFTHIRPFNFTGRLSPTITDALSCLRMQHRRPYDVLCTPYSSHNIEPAWSSAWTKGNRTRKPL